MLCCTDVFSSLHFVLFYFISFVRILFDATFFPTDHLSKQLWCMLTMQKQKKFRRIEIWMRIFRDWIEIERNIRQIGSKVLRDQNAQMQIKKREHQNMEGRKRAEGEESASRVIERKKKSQAFFQAMLPDLLCLDRLQYVSCAVRLSLCLIRSCAPFNLSFSRFTYLFWFVLFSFSSEHLFV